MSDRSKSKKASDAAAIALARAEASRDSDGNFIGADVIKLASIHIVLDDPETEKLKRATRAYQKAQQRGTTRDGQLVLPFGAPPPWYGDRIIARNDGRGIEEDIAPFAAVSDERERERENKDEVIAAFNQTDYVANRMAAWTMEQLQTGRKQSELTKGNFVKETGLWQSGDSGEPSEDEDEDAE